MRSPLNNPTERIGRLIEEFDEVLYVVQELYRINAALTWNFEGSSEPVPPMPRFPNLEAERVRRSLTYTRSIHKDRARKALDAVRTDAGSTLRQAVLSTPLSNLLSMPSNDTENPTNNNPLTTGDAFVKPDKLDI